jgi:hypothetical protein
MSGTYRARGWFVLFGSLGVMGAIAVACSSEESSTNAPGGDAAAEAESGSQTIDSSSADDSTGPDAPGDADPWFAACEAVTPPAPNCSCLCEQCAEVTANCYKDPDCTAIVTCAAQTGCRTTSECLAVCGTVITMHAAGLTAAQAFAGCFGPKCGSACSVPRDGSADGPTDAVSEGAPEDATSEASEEASMEAAAEGSTEAATDDGSGSNDAAAEASGD